MYSGGVVGPYGYCTGIPVTGSILPVVAPVPGIREPINPINDPNGSSRISPKVCLCA